MFFYLNRVKIQIYFWESHLFIEIVKRNFTVLGSETEFDGVLEFTDDLKISGKFNGVSMPGEILNRQGAVCSVDQDAANSFYFRNSYWRTIGASESRNVWLVVK